MRHAVAALVAAQALATKDETMSRTPALPEEPKLVRTSRRRMLMWSWLPSLWKATHAGS